MPSMGFIHKVIYNQQFLPSFGQIQVYFPQEELHKETEHKLL